MTHLPKALILLAALGLAACNNPDRYGAGGAGGAGGTGGYGSGGYGAGGIDSQGLGGPSDPRSIAYFQQTLGDRVFFLVDQSTLNDSARATLDTQSQWLMANADYAIIIEGHADEQGTREYNLALGARRASAVQDYLISKGIAPSRMKTVSYGKERPVEVCSTEECYSKNRRAVTVLSMGAGV
ncbi:peptidoglycan-associated lipoprotein Pal [Cereibacter azotoformans]|uniref:peptidoglycan-associated lipoprotein Pal n=1 Tax=Cereibacter azotoformans TaxID=43057 RepID=UPI001EEA4EB7|nr:peptidoglycan-associated lipoprotein Pal [Cereibacter azotoformans]ULB08870.1 peptidoglycan-associated lipoprotein Pal [Cereibacter azotoformans]